MAGSNASLTEADVIEILRERCARQRADVLLGIGDDAAVTQVPGNRALVTAVDALVEGTHFRTGAPAASIGHRCLAVNLSDLAAMGATPHWATLSLSLPAPDVRWLKDFADGFARLAAGWDVSLIGGDTVRGPLAASVTLLGTVAADGAVGRHGAALGDSVFVTGQPGRAAAGCRLLNDERQADTASADMYRRSFEYPSPRVDLGIDLAPVVTAMIDVSDGVAADLGRLMSAGGFGADLEIPDLGSLQEDFGPEQAREFFLAGGEDYELCFTAAAVADAEVMAIAERHAVAVTRIGCVTAKSGFRWRHHGKPVTGNAAGFEHFVA